MIDRRSHRSEEPLEALRFFLDAERRRLGIRALTVSDTRGRLIVGSGIALSHVASVGAEIDRTGASGGLLSNSLATWRLHVGKEQWVLTSLGRKMTANLGEGVRRILSED